jgi:hypothetical protein
VTGHCRLCRQRETPLQESHILPKWAYRRASDPAEPPVRVSAGVAFQTSAQLKEHLLCQACENLLSQDEDHVSRLAYQLDGTLPITRKVAVRYLGGTSIRYVSAQELEPRSIARFAASVFWRAHVSTRTEFKTLRLWNPQAEALRRYTLRQAELPANMSLTAAVLVDGDTDDSVHSSTIVPPCTAQRGVDSMHQFVVAGLLFTFYTGTPARSQKPVCLATAAAPSIPLTNWRLVRTMRTVGEQARHARPVGRFARRAGGGITRR